MITSLFAGFHGVLYFVMSLATIRARRSERVSLGHGDNPKVSHLCEPLVEHHDSAAAGIAGIVGSDRHDPHRHVRDDLRTHAEAFCIADETALVYRLQASRWEGIADTYEPAVAKLYGKMFDEIWLASEVEMEFRQLGI